MQIHGRFDRIPDWAVVAVFVVADSEHQHQGDGWIVRQRVHVATLT